MMESPALAAICSGRPRKRARSLLSTAEKLCEDVEFFAEDASRTNLHYLCRVLEAAIEAGARLVNIPDTVGYAIPAEFGQFRGSRGSS